MGKRIIEELATDTIQDNDFILMDNNTTPTGPDDDTAGTRKIRASEFGAQIITVDDELSDSSENPVQNKVITGAINTLASATEITGTASGSIASFDDGSALPLKDLDVSIAPIQDLHGYDNPWVGGGGKNKFDSSVFSDATSTITTIQVQLLPNTQYTMSSNCPLSSSAACIFFMLPNGSASTSTNGVYQNQSRTLTTGADGIAVVGYRAQGTITQSQLVGFNTQIEQGSQPTSYAPYENICPISGWTACNVSVCGVNLWDEEWEVGTISASTGENTSSSSRIRSKNYIKVEGGETYYFKSSEKLEKFMYDKNKNYLGTIPQDSDAKDVARTLPNDCAYIRFCVYTVYGTSYKDDISINYPSTDTSYHAYSGNTYTIQFTDGTNPLTVYGGTLDVTTGVLTVDRYKVKLSDVSNWTNNGTFANTFNGEGSVLYNRKKLIDWNDNCVCDSYKGYSSTVVASHDSGIALANSTSAYDSVATRIYVKDSRFSSYTDFVQSLQTNDIEVVFPLATPQTYSLTPTAVASILGQNNVFADTGNILACEYVKDTDIIIKKLLYKDLTATLSANATSLTITDSAITTSATYDIFTDTYGVNPTAVSVSNGSMTLTFTARGSATKVKVRVML